MKPTTRLVVILTSALALLGGADDLRAQIPADDDRQAIFGLQIATTGVEVVPVAPAEVEPGAAYSYFNERLNRRVWGFSREDGTFQYAFRGATILPSHLADPSLPAPGEVPSPNGTSTGERQVFGTSSIPPAVMMTPDGQWKLLTFRVSARVFDVETGLRWEWHGNRRVGVVHTYGDQWQVVAGRYQPLGGGMFIPTGCGSLDRVGSAAFLVRTSE